MYRRTKRARKSFLAHTVLLNRRSRRVLLYAFFLPILLLMLCGAAKIIKPIFASSVSADFLLACVRSAFPVFADDSEIVLLPSSYDVVNAALPMIPANAATAKKYAAKYNASIRAKRTEDSSDAAEEKTEILQNKKIQTLSMAAKGITFNNATDYAVDADELLAAPLAFGSRKNEPRVLIVHTHTSEAYFDSPNGRSTDPTKNVIRIGKEIADTLNTAGIVTIHDKTKNDEPDYNGSYKKALSVIQKNLLQYPSIEIVLDIHRDYTVRNAGEPSEVYLKPTQTQNGKDAAQIMFVMGTDAMDLYHPDWRHNLSFAVKIQNAMNRLHPDLCRPINVRIERFNQHMTKGSMIIEVGSASNTLEEAVRSGGYIGEAVAAVLNGN